MQTMTVNNTPAPMPEATNSAPQTSGTVQLSASLNSDSVTASTANRDMLSTDLSVEEQKAILQESTEKFNQMSDELNLDVKFAYNDKIDQIYLNVIDKNTGKVIRKLPSEEAMKISESMQELVGNLLDKKG